MTGRAITVAAAQYAIEWLDDWDAVEAKYAALVARAAPADIVVFPEYGAMELAALAGEAVARDLTASIDAVGRALPRLDAILLGLARRHDCAILAPSGPTRRPDGVVVNRARFIAPDGTVVLQDKRVMTRFEREEWGVRGGDSLTVTRFRGATIGVAICYDVEFPLVVRPLAEAGANVILAPSCTETRAGSTRVHTGAKARALENQCYVVVSQTVGEAPWSPATDVNRGVAAVYAPSDTGFPETGVVAEGRADEPGFVTATLDLDAVDAVRADGTVLNHRHWAEQPEPGELVRVVEASRSIPRQST